MLISVIGCGETGKRWFDTPCDLSIACNDAAKFGKDPDWLVVINRTFSPEREKTIKETKAKKVFTTIKYWKEYFKDAENLRLQQFGKYLKKGHVYSSKTSPFVALSLAFNAGAKNVILWGVDLNFHPVVKDKLKNYELRQFEKFCRELAKQRTQVWVSSEESALSNFLPIWTCAGAANGLDCKSNVHQFDSDHVLNKIKE